MLTERSLSYEEVCQMPIGTKFKIVARSEDLCYKIYCIVQVTMFEPKLEKIHVTLLHNPGNVSIPCGFVNKAGFYFNDYFVHSSLEDILEEIC